MKLLSLFSFVILVTLSSTAQNSPKCKLPKIKVSFDRISVVKLKPNAPNEVIERWETTNHCIYWVDRKNRTVCFKEMEPKGNTIKSWEYSVNSISEDDLTYTFIASAEDGTVNIVFWKDNSMVALEGNDATFLVGSP